MTNWKVYTITGIPTSMVNNYRGSFNLDDYVNYKRGNENWIWLINTYPYNTFKIGDKIEIDNDKTKNYSCLHEFNDFSIVRRASSSEMVLRNSNNLPSITRNQTLAIGREIDALIDQSGGRNEYEAKIHVDPDNHKVTGYSIIGRRNKNG